MTDIILKQGAGVPSDSDLEVAEVAIDSFSGAMYTKLADGSVKHLNPEGGAGSWDEITGKPIEFPPASHNHDGVYQPVGDYIEDANSDGKQYARQDGAWSEIVIPEASNTLEGSWVYSSSSATVGSFTTRNADWITAVTITLHKTDASGFEHNFALMNEGDIIYLQAPAGGAEYSVVSKSVSGDTCDFIVDPISSYGSFPSDGQSAKVNFIPQVSSGSSVHIGHTPPDTPLEGQQWMEVPVSGDATMWIYDGGKWLQHPGGKDGAAGLDGNIADATEDGVVATWDSTANGGAGQWTPDSSLTIDSSGNATFSGTVSASNSFVTGNNIWREGHSGLAFGINYIVPRDTDLNPRTSSVDIGQNNDRFKDGHFNGTVYSNGSPLTRTVDLIKTLSTLRNATKDETTLEGLRDAIGNAIGGLIEEFENQIATMPAEVEQ